METLETPRSVVVIGAGLAAANAVETLRESGFDGSITVVGREPHPPYERPPLTKGFLTGADPIEAAFPHDTDWYADKSIRLLSGTAATGIDRDTGTVTLDTGETLSYDALLLATGASPRVPDLPGAESALYVRTIDDSQRLKAAFEQGGRVAIVGGGWIGLEVAAAARGYGRDVTVIEQFDLPLGHILGAEIATYLRDLHVRNGVDVRTGVTVSAITPEGVETSTGAVPADIVVVAVGVAPDVELAVAAGLEVEDGIVVDEHLRTSDPRIYAAGDVANASNTALGRRVRVEHWDNAIRQGKLAGRVIGGEDAAYDWLPYFYTDQFDFSMEYVGRSAPGDEVVVRGSLADNEFIAYWLSGTTVTAAMNVNVWDVNDRLREIVGTSVDRDELTDLRS
ncbi:FAD-dependent oxidoreductase [Nocardioides panacihumi]|uniref:FAD-dependent oxidoreductase n=1 Tax=Nocardioides panacihumi TaxID=400774 RepID=A0ABN2QLJ7_9ACTN